MRIVRKVKSKSLRWSAFLGAPFWVGVRPLQGHLAEYFVSLELPSIPALKAVKAFYRKGDLVFLLTGYLRIPDFKSIQHYCGVHIGSAHIPESPLFPPNQFEEVPLQDRPLFEGEVFPSISKLFFHRRTKK
jgi:hypothetical protein